VFLVEGSTELVCNMGEDTKATIEPTANKTTSLEKPSEAMAGKENAGGKETQELAKDEDMAEPDNMEIDAQIKKDDEKAETEDKESEVKKNEDNAETQKMEEKVEVTKDEGQAEATNMDEDADGKKEQTDDGVSVEDTVMKENVESKDNNYAKDDEKETKETDITEADHKKAGKEDIQHEADKANGTKDGNTGDIKEEGTLVDEDKGTDMDEKVENGDENKQVENVEGKEKEDKEENKTKEVEAAKAEVDESKVEDEKEGSEDENDNEKVESKDAKEDEKEETNDDKEDEKEESKGSKKRGKGTSSGGKVREKNKTEEVKKDAEPRTPFSDRPVRERKSVERLVALIDKDSSKEFRVEKGRGAYLKDIPNVANKVMRKRSDETLKLLHPILFGGRRGKAAQIKTNILGFSGFVWHGDEKKAKEKVKEKLEKCTKEKLWEFCDVLDIHITKATTKKVIMVINF